MCAEVSGESVIVERPVLVSVKIALAFEKFSFLSSRYVMHFMAAFPTAHTLARLRFAGPVTAFIARPTTGSGGPPWPDGLCTRWTTYRISRNSSHHSTPPDQHCLVVLSCLSTPVFLAQDDGAVRPTVGGDPSGPK